MTRIIAKYRLGKQSTKLIEDMNRYLSIERKILEDAMPGDDDEILEKVAAGAEALKNAYRTREPFLSTTLAQLDEETIREFSQVANTFFRIASIRDENSKKELHDRKEAIAGFADFLSYVTFLSPTMLNSSFKRVPAEPERSKMQKEEGVTTIVVGPWKSQDLKVGLWLAAEKLGRELAESPRRLKVCPFCKKIFWDCYTKPGNQRICGKSSCNRLWRTKRATDFYHRENPLAKRRKVINESPRKNK